MSVTTSQRINADKFMAQFAGPISYTIEGGKLESANQKTITVDGVSDATVQAAVTAAAAAFVDREANVATLFSKANAALTVNATFLGLASPTNAQTLAQVQALTREVNALIRLAVANLDSTSGT